MTQGIYAIINSVHGGAYFGSSRNIELRWQNHKWLLNRGEHHNKYLQSAWNKYGADCFYFDIVEVVDRREDLPIREQRWIEIGHYNIAETAGCLPSLLGKPSPRRGIPLDDIKTGWRDALKAAYTEERRRKASELVKAYYAEHPHSDEHKRKITNTLTGRKASEETKEKQRQGQLRRYRKNKEMGKIYEISEETKEKQRHAALKRWERKRERE